MKKNAEYLGKKLLSSESNNYYLLLFSKSLKVTEPSTVFFLL